MGISKIKYFRDYQNSNFGFHTESSSIQNGTAHQENAFTVRSCTDKEATITEHEEDSDEICLEMPNNLSDSGVYSSFNLDITYD